MEFIKYDDIKKFADDNLELLLEKEWLNNLMVGNYKDAIKNGIDENWLLARVTDNGRTGTHRRGHRPGCFPDSDRDV